MVSTGRPSLFSDDLADEICIRILEGESLRRICSEDRMPSRSTVLNWLDEREDFCAKYARARELQADYMDDLILEAAEETDEDNAAAQRVRIAAYQWRAAKLKPKKYGDRQLIGNDPDNPMPAGFSVVLVKPDEA
jgi:hypothetical protein